MRINTYQLKRLLLVFTGFLPRGVRRRVFKVISVISFVFLVRWISNILVNSFNFEQATFITNGIDILINLSFNIPLNYISSFVGNIYLAYLIYFIILSFFIMKFGKVNDTKIILLLLILNIGIYYV